MKFTSILILLVMIGSLRVLAADNPPDDFADIRWGESADAAKAKMLLKPGVSLVNSSPDGSLLTFEGGTFATHPATRWALTFSKNEFIKGRVELKPADTSPPALRRTYAILKKFITAKYRKQGREEHQRGYHSATYWEFKRPKGRWLLACDVDERKPGIFLEYSFKAVLKLSSEAAKEQKKDL